MTCQIDLLILPSLNQKLFAAHFPAALLAHWQASPRWLVPFDSGDPERSIALLLSGALPPQKPVPSDSSALTLHDFHAAEQLEAFELARCRLRELTESLEQDADQRRILALTGLRGWCSDERAEIVGNGSDAQLPPLLLLDWALPCAYDGLKRYLGAMELRWLLERIAKGQNNFSDLVSPSLITTNTNRIP